MPSRKASSSSALNSRVQLCILYARTLVLTLVLAQWDDADGGYPGGVSEKRGAGRGRGEDSQNGACVLAERASFARHAGYTNPSIRRNTGQDSARPPVLVADDKVWECAD